MLHTPSRFFLIFCLLTGLLNVMVHSIKTQNSTLLFARGEAHEHGDHEVRTPDQSDSTSSDESENENPAPHFVKVLFA